MDLPLKKIAREALDTFPPLGRDRDAANNYAQRMLTKHVSEIRKSEQTVLDADVQEQRQLLDHWVNSLEVATQSDSADMSDNDDADNKEPTEPPNIEQLGAIISACFHTATDGSPEHLAVLHRRAINELNQYLSETDIGWTEKRQFKSKGKKLIETHLKDISTENGDAI